MVFCDTCGAGIQEDTAACPVCGSPLKGLPEKTKKPEIIAQRYKIEHMLGAGNMGAVYKAFDTRLNRNLAIKKMTIQSSDFEEKTLFQKWFEREAEILCRLRHPNIPVVMDFFVENRDFFMVMDYIRGKNLNDEPKPMDPEKVKTFALTALPILEYLHNSNVIHRDIKTDHFIIEESSEKLFLVDFGTARIFNSEEKQTVIGTPGFSPPEQYEGRADAKSDIYAFGAVLHHLLSGMDPRNRAPFDFKPLETLIKNCPPLLAEAVAKALEYDHIQRFSSAEEMRDFIIKGKKAADLEQTPVSKASGLRLPEEPSYMDYNVIRRSVVPSEQTAKPHLAPKIESAGGKCDVFRVFGSTGSGKPVSIGFIPPGDRLASAYMQGDIVIWSLMTGKQEKVLKNPSVYSLKIADSIDVSPSGKFIAQLIDNSKIFIWDIDSEKRVKSLSSITSGIKKIKFLSDEFLMTASLDNRLMIWDVPSEKALQVFSDIRSVPTSIGYGSKAGLAFAGTNKGKIYTWFIGGSKPDRPRIFSIPHGAVTCMNLPSTEKILLTGSDTGKVTVWKIEEGPPPVLISLHQIDAHKGPVNSISSAPHLNIFVTGGQDGSVGIWDFKSTRPLLKIHQGDEPILDVSFAENGRYFSALWEVGEILVWEI